jgi:hypothetical protein
VGGGRVFCPENGISAVLFIYQSHDESERLELANSWPHCSYFGDISHSVSISDPNTEYSLSPELQTDSQSSKRIITVEAGPVNILDLLHILFDVSLVP